MPSSANYTFTVPCNIPMLGRRKITGDTYVRVPGTARYQNLDPQIEDYAVINPQGGGVAKFIVSSLLMLEHTYNGYKIAAENSVAKYDFNWPDPKVKPEVYFVYLPSDNFGDQTLFLSDQLFDSNMSSTAFPFSSKRISASLNKNNLASLAGLPNLLPRPSNLENGFDDGIQKAPPVNSALTGNTNTSLTPEQIRNLSPEERRAYNTGRLNSPASGMANTAQSLTTSPQPQFVMVSLGTQTAGVRDYLPVILPANIDTRNQRQINAAIASALQKRGFSLAYIGRFFRDNPRPSYTVVNFPNTTSKPRGGSSSGGKNNSKFVDFGATPIPEISTKVIVRFGNSYFKPTNLSESDTRPMMVQFIKNSPIRTASDFRNGVSIRDEDKILIDPGTGKITRWVTQQATLKYVFPYVPTDIEYSSLGAQWTEVPRARQIPFVDFQGFNRMKVSFSFIISSDRIEPGGRSVPDGLYTSVDEQITLLRKMFQSKQPVTIYNMDGLLTNPADRLNKNPVQFVIADLGIEAVRRQGSLPSHITTAQVSITLNEVMVEEAVLINITPPTFDEFIPTPRIGTPTSNRPELWTKYLPQPDSVLASDSQMTIGNP